MALGQLGQRGGHDGVAAGGEGPDTQWPADAVPRACQLGDRQLEALQHGVGVGDEGPACGREDHPPAAAFQQGHARFAFQHTQLLGDGGCGEGQRLGHGRDSAAPVQFAEKVETTDIEHKFSLRMKVEIRNGSTGSV